MASQKNAKTKAKSRTNRGRAVSKSGAAAGKAILGVATIFNPYASIGGEDIDPQQIPPFIAVLTLIIALVILGFVVYVGAILLGEAWHRYA